MGFVWVTTVGGARGVVGGAFGDDWLCSGDEELVAEDHGSRLRLGGLAVGSVVDDTVKFPCVS